MRPGRSTFSKLAIGLLLLALLGVALPFARRAVVSAPRMADTQPPAYSYLLVELWLYVDGAGVLPMLCVDFPGYSFDANTGVLESSFGPLPPLLLNDLGFAGNGHQRSGAAGCGIGSGLTAIASLPYTTTIAIGTGETGDYGEKTRPAQVVLGSVDQAGTLTALIDGEQVTIAPGAQWSKLVEADLVNETYNGHYWITSSVTNYGWQSRARIVGQMQLVWAPIVTR